MDWQAVGAVGSAMAGLLAAATIAVFVWRRVMPGWRRFKTFMRHAMGVPADPQTGQPGVPSIFQRLDSQDADLAIIKHEQFPNSGGSLRDQIDGIREDVQQLHSRMDELEKYRRPKHSKWGNDT